MKYNRITILAAAAAVLLGTAACNNTKEKEFDPNDPSVMTIVAQPDSQSIIAEGGDLTFTFDAPDYWFVSSPVKWLTFEPESGKPGPVTIKVTAAQNVSAARSALITVSTKYNRGKFSIDQEAWPYSHEWTMFGTIGGAGTAQDYAMEDQGEKLVWKASKVPFHNGETFQFSMAGGDAALGLSGALAPVEGQANTYAGALVKGGEAIVLPFEAFWDVTLDLNTWTVTAVLAERYPWTYIGTINGSNWDTDFEMADKGDQLVWESTWVPFRLGEVFRFRMDKNDAVNMGLAGAFVPVEGAANTYVASVKQDGDDIALPDYGFWNLTLDLNEGTLTIALAQRFAWTYIGAINESNWDQDFEMTDMGRQLFWQALDVPFHFGDEFRFRMDKNDVVNLGIDGEFTPIEGAVNAFEAKLKQDGGNIALPAEGWWMLNLDVENGTLTATLTKEFPRVFPGVFWENDGSAGAVSWSSTYRFGLDGKDGNHECITTFPQEVWDKIKTETFYLVVRSENPQIRVTTGWWGAQWHSDFMPGNELLTDNGDGTWTLKINLTDAPDLLEAMDQQHLLFTGDRFTPIGLYPEIAWENDGSVGAISWSSQYRFGMDGHDGNNECLITFPETPWNKFKTGTFYLDLEATNPQIRVVTGWWGAQWLGDDIYPGNERLQDNGDGTFTLTVNLVGEPIIDLLDQQHLLFTGDRYKPLRIRIPW